MRRPAAALFLLASLLPHRALAQGETAAPLRPGAIRLTLGGDWAHYADVFGKQNPLDPVLAEGSRQPLGTYFGADPLGTDRLSILAPVEQRLRTLTGLSTYRLSLGRSVLTLDASVRITPIRIEVAASRRFGLSVAVPIVRARQSAFLRGPDSTAATQGNVGLNPAYLSPGALDAFRLEVDSALLALQAQAASGPAGLRAQAQGLYDQLQPALCGMYALAGGSAADPASPCYSATPSALAPVLPVTTSEAGDSLNTLVSRGQSDYAALAAQYAGLGVSLPAFTQGIGLPTAPLDSTGLRRLFSDPGGPLAGDSLSEVVRTGIGDVEVGAWYQLAAGARWRSQLALTVRLPTGTMDDPDNFIDIGTGDHQLDIELATRNDLVFSRRLWLYVGARFGLQRPGELERRVSPWYRPFAAPATKARVRRDPGDYVALDLSPNWRLDEGFSVGLGYRFYHQGATSYAYRDPADETRIGSAAAVLGEGTAVTRMRIGAAATFSTLDRYETGRARLPLRVTWGYQNTFWGRGGQVPHAGVMTLLVQVYMRSR